MSQWPYDSVIFDLDGTLWDASATTAKGWRRVAEKHNLALTIDDEAVRQVSGLPFDECVDRVFGEAAKSIPDLHSELDQAEKKSIENWGGKLYPGVTEGLKALKAHYPLFLVSNCQIWYLQAFFNHSKLAPLFQDALSFGHTFEPKAENLKALAKRNDLKNALYIGDTQWDFDAATKAGMKFGFVTYGFGEAPGAHHEFASARDWTEALL